MKQRLDMTPIESSADWFLGDLRRRGKQLRKIQIKIDDPRYGCHYAVEENYGQ